LSLPPVLKRCDRLLGMAGARKGLGKFFRLMTSGRGSREGWRTPAGSGRRAVARSCRANKGGCGTSKLRSLRGAAGFNARPAAARIPTPARAVARRRRKWRRGGRRGREWESFSGAWGRSEGGARARVRPSVAAVTVLAVRRLAPRLRPHGPLPCRALGVFLAPLESPPRLLLAPPLPVVGYPGAASAASSAGCMRRRRRRM
jgi:hypothetical protein